MERTRVMQAPNRATVWSRTQNAREVAMAGPRFEQTVLEAQVCCVVFIHIIYTMLLLLLFYFYFLLDLDIPPGERRLRGVLAVRAEN